MAGDTGNTFKILESELYPSSGIEDKSRDCFGTRWNVCQRFGTLWDVRECFGMCGDVLERASILL